MELWQTNRFRHSIAEGALVSDMRGHIPGLRPIAARLAAFGVIPAAAAAAMEAEDFFLTPNTHSVWRHNVQDRVELMLCKPSLVHTLEVTAARQWREWDDTRRRMRWIPDPICVTRVRFHGEHLGVSTLSGATWTGPMYICISAIANPVSRIKSNSPAATSNLTISARRPDKGLTLVSCFTRTSRISSKFKGSQGVAGPAAAFG